MQYLQTDAADRIGEPADPNGMLWAAVEIVSSFFFLIEARREEEPGGETRVVRYVTSAFSEVARLRERASLVDVNLFLCANTDAALGRSPILKKVKAVHSSDVDGPLSIVFEDGSEPLLTSGAVLAPILRLKRLFPLCDELPEDSTPSCPFRG